MPNVLVLYYSSYGHIEIMARAQAEGVARIPNVQVLVKRVPETVPSEVAKSSGFKLDQAASFANPDELDQYDAIIFGTPTRFGNMAGQMRTFLDQTGGLWGRGALVGKVGSVFCSTASQHGGQETTLTSFHSTLLHHGMIIVGLPYTFKALTTLREVTGGTPYGASCVTGVGDELRMPSDLELEMCRFQGEHVSRIASRLGSARAA
ncbi:MAG TPA: NAD(P)H:quinone oxidoreductase [Steroidobacteraceae bacterium]|jgi:NAD(P)H dehydrogenase (quinone)|nr:NAD(P)H:quinone oxidoreductase [Steroidobacteraceae bacterium]